MATVSNSNQQYASTITNQRADNKETGDKKGKDSKDKLKKELEKLLRTYEKGKAKLWHKILEATTKSHNELEQLFANDPVSKLSDLAHALESDPTAALSSPDSIREGTGVSKELENFFMLIFKFLKDHKEGQSKMEISQAVNTQGKEKLLAQVTKASMDSVATMKKKIDDANNSKNGWLKIFLPIAIVVVTIICVALTLVTGGASDVAAGAADTALAGADAAAEVTTDVAVDTTVEATISGLSESVDVGGDAGFEMTDASSFGSNAVEEGAEESSQAIEETVSQVSEAGENAGSDAASEGDEAAEETAENTAKETAKETAKDTAKETAKDATKDAAKKSIKDRILDPIRGMSKGQRATAFLTTAGAAVGAGVGLNSNAQSQCNDKINEATQIEQGEMTVDSSASEGLQTDIRANMQYQQQEMSQTEADSSQLQNVLQKQASMYTIGSFNA
ncbi:MAG: hypothetical protein S4CHLAM37_11850 [Chlamydiia bacterium]|nr:hypothetical protein [Chlamydiia bacterium]